MMYVMHAGECLPDDRPWLISTRDMPDVDADDIDIRVRDVGIRVGPAVASP